jgi:fucose 4-O-acetylase-like acetyltransferase
MKLVAQPRDDESSSRLAWIDAIRGLAIVLVVVGHSFWPPTTYANTVIFSFHLPLFFIANGYLFSFAGRGLRPFSSLALSSFKRLVIPYVTTGVLIYLYWLVAYRFLVDDPKSVTTMLVDRLMSIAYGSGNLVPQIPRIGDVGPTWFLLALFVAVLLFWLLVRAARSIGAVGRLALVAAVSVAGVGIGQHIRLPWSVDIAMAVQIFLLAGYEIHRLDILSRVRLWWMPLLLALWGLDVYRGGVSLNNRSYFFFPLAVAGAVGVVLLLMKGAQLLQGNRLLRPRVMVFLGVQTLVILCFHMVDISWNWLDFIQPIYSHWYLLALWRLAFSLLIATVITWIPVLRSAYYWDRWPLQLRGRRKAPEDESDSCAKTLG